MMEEIKEFKRKQAESALEMDKNPNPFYTFSSTGNTGGLMREVMIALYQKALVEHKKWLKQKQALKQGNENNNHMKRIDTEIHLEENYSPFLIKIEECIRIVDDLEAEKKGTQDEKSLSTFDKYKLAVKFMQMTQSPQKFKYLERFMATEDNQVRMNLAPKDLERRLKLVHRIKKNDAKKDELRNFRREIADKVKKKKDEYRIVEDIFLPTNTNEDISGMTPMNDPATKKLEIPINPMEKKKIEVNFPKSQSTSNKYYIKA